MGEKLILMSCRQFDSKAEVEAYIRTLPIQSAFFMPALFMQMMTHRFKPKLVRRLQILLYFRSADDPRTIKASWSLV